MEKVIKGFSADISIEDGERAIIATMTTNTVDRDGECLIPQGMNATQFEKNPVVMLQHNYFELPVGKVTAIKRGQGKWTAKIVPAERPETHPANLEWTPDTVYHLFKQGVMNAVSIGLIPRETRPATDKDIETFGAGCRRVISKFDLLELSLCAIPCNPDAVATAVGKGITRSEDSIKIFGEAKAEETPEIKPEEKTEEKTEDSPTEEVKEEEKAEGPVIEPEPMKHVVRSIEQEVVTKHVKHVHRFIVEPKTRPPIKKMVVAEIQKRRGRIYR